MGKWLTEMRIKAGYKSIRSLSAESKVDVSTLARIEKGVHIPSPETLRRLAPFLETPYVQLLGIAGHLDEQDLGSLKITPSVVAPVEPAMKKTTSSFIEDDWPEVAQVLRSAGSLATVAERKKIARIIRATLAEEEKEGD